MRISIYTNIERVVSSAPISARTELSTEVEFDCEEIINSNDKTVSDILDDQIKKHIEYHKAQNYEATKTCVD